MSSFKQQRGLLSYFQSCFDIIDTISQTRFIMDLAEYQKQLVSQNCSTVMNKRSLQDFLLCFKTLVMALFYFFCFVFPISVHALHFSFMKSLVFWLYIPFISLYIVFYHYLHLKQGCHIQNEYSVQKKGLKLQIKDATSIKKSLQYEFNNFVLVS